MGVEWALQFTCVTCLQLSSLPAEGIHIAAGIPCQLLHHWASVGVSALTSAGHHTNTSDSSMVPGFSPPFQTPSCSSSPAVYIHLLFPTAHPAGFKLSLIVDSLIIRVQNGGNLVVAFTLLKFLAEIPELHSK